MIFGMISCIILAFGIPAGVMELADVPDSKSGGSDTVRVRPPLPAPNKNESYDTIGIATFVLFFLSKTSVAQGFLAM